MPRLLIVIVALGAIAFAPSPKCQVEATPRLAQEPLRWIRVKATIEDRGAGKITLVDAFAEWTSSELQPGARTTWTEWKDLGLPAAEYEVVLQTAGGCVARTPVEVR